jgi:hypothetical protein
MSRLIEIEAFDLQVKPVWQAEITVVNHDPQWGFNGDMIRKMRQAGYDDYGDLISAIGHWVVVFETLDGTGEPAVLYLGNIQMSPKSFGNVVPFKEPFEVPKRRNYKLPPGWHWAKFNELWIQRRPSPESLWDLRIRHERFMNVQEVRVSR